MSIRAQNWAFGHPECETSSQQFVLYVYASFANQHDCAYLAAETIASKTKLDIKTVRACVAWLERAELMQDTGRRVGRTGQIKVYRMAIESHPNVDGFSSGVAPEGVEDDPGPRRSAPAQRHPKADGFASGSPAAKAPVFSGKAPVSGAEGTRKRETEPKEPEGEPSPLSPPRGATRDRGRSISEGWQPPAISDLPSAARAAALSWPPGAYAAQGEAFAAWARGGDERKADWSAAWCSWVVRQTGQVMRDARAGVRYPSETSAEPAATAEGQLANAERMIAFYRKIERDDDVADWERRADRLRHALAGGG